VLVTGRADVDVGVSLVNSVYIRRRT
jgi:hypothetical protein